MANAAAVHAKVAAAALKHGGAARLKRVLPGTLDHETDKTTPPATIEYDTRAIFVPTAPLSGIGFGESLQQGGNRVVRGEVAYISPSSFPAGVEPVPGDTLIVVATGLERTITTVKALRLDGTQALIYELVVSP